MQHVVESVPAADRLFDSFRRLAQTAGLAGGLGPAPEDERKGGIVLGRERLRSFEQVEGSDRVESECAFPGEQRVAGCAWLDLGLQGGVAGDLSQGERFAGVVGKVL